MKNAVVLLSGGLDSSTALAMARNEGYELYALTLDYGQRHSKEVESAKGIARHFRVREHRILKIDLGQVSFSALTSLETAVPENRSLDEIGRGIPSTYVPARNTILLSFALGWAETMDADAIYIAANALDYSVAGDTQVWVKTPNYATLMPIREFYELPSDEYSTLSVNPETLRLEWRRVTARFRHMTERKVCFKIRLERGQGITVTEDHSLFTLDSSTVQLTTVKGSQVYLGMPLIVPFDLSPVAPAWQPDLKSLNLEGLPRYCKEESKRWSLIREGGHITNRLHNTRLPVNFPITDDFLYIIGLWLAEGGKELASRNSTLAFSIGGVPGAAEVLISYFGPYGIRVGKSPANDYDYSISSSVFAGLFEYFNLFGTSSNGEKKFPSFYWGLSQRQRRIIISGLWDGDGSHVFKREAVLYQKSHQLIRDAYHSLTLDGIFPSLSQNRRGQKGIILRRAQDFRRFVKLYPLRHTSKRLAFENAAAVRGRDQATGLWKSPGLWNAVSSASLGPGLKTKIYNSGGKYDVSYRAQRSAFAPVPSLSTLVNSSLAFLRVTDIQEARETWMFDLSVEGAENFVANGILAHNSGYPDCRPEYYEAFQRVAALGTKRGVEGRPITIRTPLLHMTKAQIIREGNRLGVPYELTWSCYLGGERACGRCDSCQLRLKGFREAGLSDPLEYEGHHSQ